MKKITNKAVLAAKVIGGIALIGVFVFNAMSFILKSDQPNNLSLFKLQTAFADGEEGGTEGCSGSTEHYWHPNSNIESIWSKLSESNPTTSSATAENGNIEVATTPQGNPINLSISGAQCANITYSLTSYKYECEGDWFSPKCLQKEEHTVWNASVGG